MSSDEIMLTLLLRIGSVEFHYHKPIKVSVYQGGTFPPTVTHITFENYYNHPVHTHPMPNTVTHITFGKEFNLPVDNLLPQVLPT